MARKLKDQHVRNKKTRGFHQVDLPHETLWVRDGMKLVPCHGEAHSNAHIDNCSVCMGATWGMMVVPDKEV